MMNFTSIYKRLIRGAITKFQTSIDLMRYQESFAVKKIESLELFKFFLFSLLLKVCVNFDSMLTDYSSCKNDFLII